MVNLLKFGCWTVHEKSPAKARVSTVLLQREAIRFFIYIPKYASVSAYMRDVLRWLPVSQRILYRISAIVWRSVTGCAPSYLTNLYRPVSDLASRRALRSPARGELLVPRARSALKSFLCYWPLHLE